MKQRATTKQSIGIEFGEQNKTKLASLYNSPICAPSYQKDYHIQIKIVHSEHQSALPMWLDFPEIAARGKQEAVKRAKKIAFSKPIFAKEILQVICEGKTVTTMKELQAMERREVA